MSKLQIHQFPARSDNYGVLVHDPETGATASIDAPDAEAVLAALHEKGWELTHILITHHHHDHTAGNEVLKRMTGCTIVGPAKEARGIPGIDIEVSEGDTVEIGNVKGQSDRDAGPHKRPCQLLLSGRLAVFVGDTLFSIGCGKLLEGDAKTMWASLAKAAAAPARDDALLRPRIYPRQCALRADRRAGERSAAGPRDGGRQRLQPKGRAGASHHHRPRACHQSVPQAVRAPRSRSVSAWRGGRWPRSSARSASARTGSSSCPVPSPPTR